MAGRLLSAIRANSVDGIETLSRTAATAALTMSSGTFRAVYFTPFRDFTATRISTCSGATAAGATPTLIRMGIYSIAANGNATLIASTPNDTTLYGAQNTVYTKDLSASVALTYGQRYAFGWLIVTGAATPTIVGMGISATGATHAGIAPRITGAWAGQTDIPSSYTEADMAVSASCIWAAIRPAA